MGGERLVNNFVGTKQFEKDVGRDDKTGRSETERTCIQRSI